MAEWIESRERISGEEVTRAGGVELFFSSHIIITRKFSDWKIPAGKSVRNPGTKISHGFLPESAIRVALTFRRTVSCSNRILVSASSFESEITGGRRPQSPFPMKSMNCRNK